MEGRNKMAEKVDKHKEKLMRDISEEVTTLFEKTLDYAEVAVTNTEQYKKLRSKILRHGNNCIRNISRTVSNNYTVRFEPPAETIIESRIANAVKE
jgi:hypothetical protein